MLSEGTLTGVVVPIVIGVLSMLITLGVFAYLYSRHRVMTQGVRGTALVVDVRPISMIQRRSVTERPTENVTVATAAVPRGVRVDQKVPAGQYRVGQTVPVVQARGNPHKIFLDRPDLERPAVVVYAPLFAIAFIPVIIYLAITNG